MNEPKLPRLEVSAELIEQRIHEVATLNRLCHALAKVGATLKPRRSSDE